MAEERLGLKVEPLTPALAEQLGYDQAGGVVISDVQRTSPAARRGMAGFRGYRLEQVNETPIATPEDVQRALAGVKGGEIVSLHVRGREGDTRVFNVRMPD
jgi:serine protease Do